MDEVNCGHAAPTGERQNRHEILVEKHEGKRPLGGHRRCEDKIKANLEE